MKNIVISIILVMFVLATAACSRRRTASPHPWPLVNEVVDTLSQRLDEAIFHTHDGDSIGAWTARMKEQAQLFPNDGELAERALYYEAMNLRYEGEMAAADSIFLTIKARLDSAAHPYLFNRIAWQTDNNPVRDAAAYFNIKARLDYFLSAGDDFIAGAHYITLGNLLKNVRDPEGAVAAYRSADSLYRIVGATDIATFNRINLASTLVVARDTASAVALLEELRDNEYVKSRQDVEEIVLEKLYQFANDTTALLRQYELQHDRPGPVTLMGMSNYELNRGDASRALDLAQQAFDTAVEDGDPDFAALSMYAMSQAYAAAGDIESAYIQLRDAVDLTDQISLANEPGDIAALETMRAIANRRLEAELNHSKATLRYVSVAFVLFLLLVVTAWVISLRMQRLKTQRLRAMRQRDMISRKLIATQIARTESERLINSVGREIGDMADSGRLPAGETRRIVNAIKSHAVKQGDRETFIESFSMMHPDFAQRLRELNPAFTEPDIRLATYIAMGMDSKHIADTMGVRPESVKQARWRLRTKLSLAKGESLEQAIRQLLGS